MTTPDSNFTDSRRRLQVPTYTEGSTIINESMAIVQWLEMTHPEKPLTPKGREAEVRPSAGFSEIFGHPSAVQRSHPEKLLLLKGLLPGWHSCPQERMQHCCSLLMCCSCGRKTYTSLAPFTHHTRPAYTAAAELLSISVRSGGGHSISVSISALTWLSAGRRCCSASMRQSAYRMHWLP